MAKKDKSDRIISMIRGALYVDVVARLNGKITELRFLKDHTDREICDMVLDTKTPPLLGENSIEKQSEEKALEQSATAAQTVPTPVTVPKNRASRQDMIAALKAAGVTGVNVNNRNALEAAYAKLQGGDK